MKRALPFRFLRFGWARVRGLVGFLAVWGLVYCVGAGRTGAAEPLDPEHAAKMTRGLEVFRGTVRPVLVGRCLECHGGAKVEGEFDLATREALLRGGAEGQAVLPGNAAKSRLIGLVKHAREPHMPAKGARLSDLAIEALEKWIELGAPYDAPLVAKNEPPDAWISRKVEPEARKFWSFLPLAQVTPPEVKDKAWPRTSVDSFILAKLEAQGISPSPLADKRALIRRASFDLIGLPPTPEEVAAFVNDADPQAYENLLDRLLASPHYGERWARYWLDVARFAESHGFEQDYDRPHAYHFRDFVIRALNDDLPYTTFVRWQLAGDEFEPRNPLALMATGFLGAGVFPTQITANEVESSRYDALDDMAATTGTAFLGLTVGCARCHDHKFDPIPAADYYRFVATFTTTVRSNLDVEVDANTEARRAYEQAHEPLVLALKKYEAEQLPQRLAEWEAQGGLAKTSPTWRVIGPLEAKSQAGATFTPQGDGSLLVTGANAAFDTYTLVARVPLAGATGLRIEALADPSLVRGGPGRAGNGNFALTNVRVTARHAPGDQEIPLKLTNPQATFNQGKHLHVDFTIDGDPKSAWAVDPQFGRNHAAIYELNPTELAGEVLLTVTLEFNNNAQHNIGRVRLSLTQQPKPLALDGEVVPQAVTEAFKFPAERRTAAQTGSVLAWFAPRDAAWRTLREAEQAHAATAPAGKVEKIMVASEGVPPIRHHTQGADFFEQVFFLQRGDNNQKVAPASQSFLQVLMPPAGDLQRWQETPPPGSKTSYRRRALANWITDTDQGAGHLLARVIVNRLWQHHFGTGIVASANDFGFQGERPSHPELLDYLARDFLENGWKIKRMHKLIMLSSVYRQSSGRREAEGARRLAEVDPQNRLLAAFPVRRHSAEVLRDSMLAVSGTLDRTLYGPGTLDEAHTRRSIYFQVKRSRLIPMMQLFDSPEPLVSVGARPATTIAPQALLFMNNAQVRRYAVNFANRLAPELAKEPRAAISRAYQLALAREPVETEMAATLAFYERQVQAYTQAQRAAAPSLALADVCQVLFSLNEFAYGE